LSETGLIYQGSVNRVVAGNNKLLIEFTAAFIFALAGTVASQTTIPHQKAHPLDKTVDDRATKEERARVLIERARVAVGGEDALIKVQSLSVSGKLRRFIKYVSVQSPTKVVDKEKTLSGKIEFDFLFPARFRKKVSGQTLRGFGYSYVEIVNGERAWRNPPLRTISSRNDSRVVDVDDFERTIELQARGARQQVTIYLLGWLLQSLPTFPLKFSYAGQFETFSGRANVIVVDGPENFQLFLLLDPQTNLPISVAATFVEPRQQTVIVEAALFFDRRSMMETFLRARNERKARTKPPQRYELHLQFSDYRQIAGLSLPHRITTLLNDETIEDVTFDGFEINRPINPKKFEGQPDPKY
jgi:hypothetical protein